MAKCQLCEKKSPMLKTDKQGLCTTCSPVVSGSIRTYNEKFRSFLLENELTTDVNKAIEVSNELMTLLNELKGYESKGISIFDFTTIEKESENLIRLRNKRFLKIIERSAREAVLKAELMPDSKSISILVNETLEKMNTLKNLLDASDSKVKTAHKKLEKSQNDVIQLIPDNENLATFRTEPLGKLYKRIQDSFNVEDNRKLAKVDLLKAQKESEDFRQKLGFIIDIFNNRMKRANEYEIEGKREKAVEIYEKILKDEYWDIQPYKYLIQFYNQKGNDEQEYRVLEALFAQTRCNEENLNQRWQNLKLVKAS